MPFHQYTQCYNHTPGDKPFNASDLLGFVLGASAPGLIAAILAFLSGSTIIGIIAVAIQYAATVIAVANQWLFHRLVCLTGNQCAVGSVETIPKVSPLLGAFDNDEFFDIRLMPHRHNDEYQLPDFNFFAPASSPELVGTPPWAPPFGIPGPGTSLDGLTEGTMFNDMFLDKFQGSQLVMPTIQDLPYTPVTLDETPLNDGSLPSNRIVTRCTLHSEAEGNFWAEMKATAALQGLAVGAGAGAGAAAGCAIGFIFGPIGCVIGAILGGLLGAAGGAYIAANAAFNSDPGDINDDNVGDQPLGQLQNGDRVVVFGTHVYDGFHSGWHEIHPLMTIIKFPDLQLTLPYIEWDPNWPGGQSGPLGLSSTDMQQGLDSPAFRTAATNVRDQWCSLLTDAFSPPTQTTQQQPQNRWTIHPSIDGCVPESPPPPIR